MDVDGAGGYVGLILPNVLEQLIAGDNQAAVVDQVSEQEQFFGGHNYQFAVLSDFAAAKSASTVLNSKRMTGMRFFFGTRRSGLPPERGARIDEGLGHVIIGA